VSPGISERSFEEAIECALLRYGPDACAGDATAVRRPLATWPRVPDEAKRDALLPQPIVPLDDSQVSESAFHADGHDCGAVSLIGARGVVTSGRNTEHRGNRSLASLRDARISPQRPPGPDIRDRVSDSGRAASSQGRIKIVIPGDHPLQIAGSPHLNRLEPYGDVHLFTDPPRSSAEKVARASDADVILNTRGSVTWGEAEFEQLPNLRLIATCSIGTDMIDLIAARRRGISVCNQPGRTAPVVAEHIFGMMFALAKRAAFCTAAVKAGEWPRVDNVMLQGKVLGVIGTGATGAETARLARAIGMEVIAWTFNPSHERAARLGLRYVELDELLRRSDVVSLHVALSNETRGLIGKRELALMKPGALLINGARGALVDTSALAEALSSGHLGGAGVDVYEREPPPADHPLFACEQVVLTPHCADMTPEGVELLNAGVVDNVIEFLEGRPRNLAN
jgi:D-3-phosphoglycerate dehydrogenase